MAQSPEDVEIEAAIRRYLGKLGRRYVPFVVGLACFVLVVTLVPTVSRTGGATTGANSVAAGGPVAGAGSPTGGANPANPDGGSVAAGPAAGPSSGGSAAGGMRRTDPSAGSSLAAGITPPAAVGAAGTARSGVTCGPGVRQVPWSAYAPLCQRAYQGNNGGATSHGVTKDTITMAFRESSSAQDAAVQAAAGAAAPAPDPEFEADMNTYINYFNSQYELYGRHVVLKPYKGQSDYIQEDQGNDAPQAQADAQTERDMGAFADATFYLKASEVFQNALTNQKVVSFGALGLPQKWFERHAPYAFSAFLDGTKAAHWMSSMSCERMAGMNAEFAHDPLYQKTPRKFGLITPENPDYVEIGNEIEGGLRGCGVSLAKTVRYQIDVATFESQAATLTAQLKAAGVTTVLCYCDPLVPIFLSNSAAGQNYFPEWVEPYYGDLQARLMDKNEWSGAISEGAGYPAKAQFEAYRVFKLAKPNAEPAEQYYAIAYITVLHMFAGLQAAGPNLTPDTLQRGFFSLPASTGIFNDWGGGSGQFTPFTDTSLAWWDNNAISNFDGKAGAWRDCDGGARFKFADPHGWGPSHTRLHCFGR
ncbi:MAG: hypothetical protein NVS3B12_31460 [Acidimicrobiales bacterium]